MKLYTVGTQARSGHIIGHLVTPLGLVKCGRPTPPHGALVEARAVRLDPALLLAFFQGRERRIRICHDCQPIGWVQ